MRNDTLELKVAIFLPKNSDPGGTSSQVATLVQVVGIPEVVLGNNYSVSICALKSVTWRL